MQDGQLDWHKVDTVLLDMDGTLLDLHFDNHFWQRYLLEHLAARDGRSFDAVRAELIPKFLETRGTLAWYSTDYWSDLLQVDIMAIKAELTEKIAYRPTVEAFLMAMRGKKQVVLATNADPKVVALKEQVTQLSQYLDHSITSHDLGYPKEDQAFWQRLQDVVGFDPERTLFIDDNLDVLDAARQYGIHHLLSIAKPDSANPVQQFDGYHMLEDYQALTLALQAIEPPEVAS